MNQTKKITAKKMFKIYHAPGCDTAKNNLF